VLRVKKTLQDAVPGFALFISRKMIAIGMTKLMARNCGTRPVGLSEYWKRSSASTIDFT
jgi:hypothetical protein